MGILSDVRRFLRGAVARVVRESSLSLDSTGLPVYLPQDHLYGFRLAHSQ